MLYILLQKGIVSEFFPIMYKQVNRVNIITLMVNGVYIHNLKTRDQDKETRQLIVKQVLNTEIRQLTVKNTLYGL